MFFIGGACTDGQCSVQPRDLARRRRQHASRFSACCKMILCESGFDSGQIVVKGDSVLDAQAIIDLRFDTAPTIMNH